MKNLVTKQSFIGYECAKIEEGLYILFRDLLEETEDGYIVDEYSVIVDATEEIVETNIKFYKTLAKKQEYVKIAKLAQQYLNDTDWVVSQLGEYQMIGKALPDRAEILAKREDARVVIRNAQIVGEA